MSGCPAGGTVVEALVAVGCERSSQGWVSTTGGRDMTLRKPGRQDEASVTRTAPGSEGGLRGLGRIRDAGVCVLLSVLLIGCGFEEDSNPRGRIVSDSVGVEVVWPKPDFDAAPRWQTGLDPSLEIGAGADEGTEGEDLFRVVGAVSLGDGGLVVANRGTRELLVYDGTGGFLRSLGGEGEGPGEFRDITFLARLPGDTILVHDRSLLRLSLFHPGTGFLRTLRFPGPEAAPFQIVGGVLSRRAVVSWSLMKEPPQTPGIHTTIETVGVFEMGSGAYTAMALLNTMEEGLGMNRGRLMRTFPPYARKSDVVAGRENVYILQSTNDRSIEVYDTSGDLARVLRIDVPRVEVDSRTMDAWIEDFIEDAAEGSDDIGESLRRSFEDTPTPDSIPLIRSLVTDTDGNVCAERYPEAFGGPPVFWCFSPDGLLLRVIALREAPSRGLHPFHDAQLEIGEDFVLGVWEDELGREYVRRYPLSQVR